MAGILIACEGRSDATILKRILQIMKGPSNVNIRQYQGAPYVRSHLGEIASAERWTKVVVLLDGKEKRRMDQVDRSNLPDAIPICFLFLKKYLEEWIPSLMNEADGEQHALMARFKIRASNWAAPKLDQGKVRGDSVVLSLIEAVNCHCPNGSRFPDDFPARKRRR